MKVLTVDDSKTMRRIISSIVQTLGFTVVEAENGDKALERLSQESEIGLVLLDWNMPGMNGLEVLKTIKSDARFKDIPVMMVTTEGERSHIVAAIQVGASNYLTKPFSDEELSEKVMACLGIGGT